MSEIRPSRVGRLLKLRYAAETEGKPLISHENTYAILIGVLGMLLPLLLYLCIWLDSHYTRVMPSISHYHFTRANPIYILVFSLMAFHLIVYRGFSESEFYITLLAGMAAVCVLLFPTNNMDTYCCDPYNSVAITRLRDSDFRTTVHYIAAAVFLVCLAWMSLFKFTRSSQANPANRTANKRLRNRIYRICGVVMLLSVAFIAYAFFLAPDGFKKWYDNNNLTFWMEAIAVESFGISWLVRSKKLIGD
jgi:hypothetical protein